MWFIRSQIFTIIDENMLKTDFEPTDDTQKPTNLSNSWRDKYPDFDELEDIETLAMQENWCMIRT